MKLKTQGRNRCIKHELIGASDEIEGRERDLINTATNVREDNRASTTTAELENECAWSDRRIGEVAVLVKRCGEDEIDDRVACDRRDSRPAHDGTNREELDVVVVELYDLSDRAHGRSLTHRSRLIQRQDNIRDGGLE